MFSGILVATFLVLITLWLIPKLKNLNGFLKLNRKRGNADWVLSPDITINRITKVPVAPNRYLHVINDYHAAKEIFSKEEFSTRNPVDFTRKHRFLDFNTPVGILFNNGEQWSNQRRFSLRTLRDFGFGKKSLEDAMNTEVDEMIETYAAAKGDVKISTDFNVPIINVLWQMVAGTRITPDDPKSMRMVFLVNELFTAGGLFRMLPFWLVKLFPDISGYRARANILEEHKAYLLDTIEQHEQSFDPQHLRDFIDVYLAQVKESKDEKYTKGDLCAILMDFFHAGTETSSTTMKWILLYLALNQEVQKKCRDEIRKCIGDGRPEMIHMTSLPFTMATIAEIQRLSCVAPLTLIHNTTKTVDYQGYTFPKGCSLVGNLSFIMKDPKYFKDPLSFNPGRFIDKDGNFVRDERVIPFGTGKRVCMGELLARNEVFLFTANLIQKLRFLPPINHPAPDPEDYIVNTTTIPNDYHIKIEAVTE